MDLNGNNVGAIKNNAIEKTIERLIHNPPNNLPNEVYQRTVKAGWDDQWLNWDDMGGNGEDEQWGDIGD